MKVSLHVQNADNWEVDMNLKLGSQAVVLVQTWNICFTFVQCYKRVILGTNILVYQMGVSLCLHHNTWWIDISLHLKHLRT